MPNEIERPKFLIDLLAELDTFEAVYHSHDKVEEGETVRGTLSPWLQRAYSLARYYTKQARLLAVEREHSTEKEFSDDPDISEMKNKAEILMQILWGCVRSELNLWAEPSVGVRENFTVVRTDGDDGNDEVRKLLKKMFDR